MTITQHKRTAVASMFQNGISRNTKCAERDGFRREGHKFILLLQLICLATLNNCACSLPPLANVDWVFLLAI